MKIADWHESKQQIDQKINSKLIQKKQKHNKQKIRNKHEKLEANWS